MYYIQIHTFHAVATQSSYTITAEAVVDGWLYSGDGGYIDERGIFFIFELLKDMVISGGENIYSSDIETVL